MLRKILPILLAIFVAGAAASCCKKEVTDKPTEEPAAIAAAEADDDLVELVIVATNDVHGYILPRKLSMAIDEEGKIRYPADIGGVEWLAGYLDILRRQNPGRVLLLDGGDMFQGTMISNKSEGATVVAAMNHLGYAAASVGNHEFDFGPVGEGDDGDPYGALKAVGKLADFPLLAANLVDRKTGTLIDWEGFAPTRMIELSGIKIGIVGGPTDTTPTYSKKRVGEGLEFRPLVEIVKEQAPKLRAQGAQIIIGLLHAGGVCEEFDDPNDTSTCDPNEELFQIAQALEPGTVDLLIGGHTHHIVRHIVNGIPLMESGGTGKLFGMVTLKFSKKAGKVVDFDLSKPVGICHYRFEGTESCVYLDELPGEKRLPPIFKGEEVSRVEFLASLLSPDQRQMLEEAQEQLGATAVRDLYRQEETEDRPMGLLITHIMLDNYPEAQIALFNGSGIRSSLFSGPVTREAVFQVLPFDSTPAFLHLRGKDLKDLLRLITSGAHGMPVMRGLKLHVDRKLDECIQEDWNKDGKKEKWERNLLVSATLENGSPLEDDKVYTVVTTSYLAGGGSDISRILDKLPPETVSKPDKPPTTRDMLTNWLRDHPVELGGPDDPFTRHPDGPLLKVDNYEHQPGTECSK
jgi:5'-nucleotidase